MTAAAGEWAASGIASAGVTDTSDAGSDPVVAAEDPGPGGDGSTYVADGGGESDSYGSSVGSWSCDSVARGHESCIAVGCGLSNCSV